VATICGLLPCGGFRRVRDPDVRQPQSSGSCQKHRRLWRTLAAFGDHEHQPALDPEGWRQCAFSEVGFCVSTVCRLLARIGRGGAATACLLSEAKQNTSTWDEHIALWHICDKPCYPARVRYALKSRLRLPSKKVRALALDAIEKRVASLAADLAPTIKQLQAAGNTTLRALAAGLNAMGITTARGGNWDRTQVRRLLVRI
jgi:Recombinase